MGDTEPSALVDLSARIAQLEAALDRIRTGAEVMERICMRYFAVVGEDGTEVIVGSESAHDRWRTATLSVGYGAVMAEIHADSHPDHPALDHAHLATYGRATEEHPEPPNVFGVGRHR